MSTTGVRMASAILANSHGKAQPWLSRQSAVSSRQSAVASQQSAVRNRQSAVGSPQSARSLHQRDRRRAMKLIGVLLIVFGVLALAIGGIRYTKQEKILDIGPIEATH